MTIFDTRARIISYISGHSGQTYDNITPEKHLQRDLGMDSLDMVALLIDIEQNFDIRITDDEAEKIVTVDDAIRETMKRLAT